MDLKISPDTIDLAPSTKIIVCNQTWADYDLTIDPPPDLAIEVDLTSRTNLDTYVALKIPELWIYRQATLFVHQFNGYTYEETVNS